MESPPPRAWTLGRILLTLLGTPLLLGGLAIMAYAVVLLVDRPLYFIVSFVFFVFGFLLAGGGALLVGGSWIRARWKQRKSRRSGP